jgi:hypothetical protein
MSSDDVDEDLLDLLRKHLGLIPQPGPPDTHVLSDAEFICDNSVDVALSMHGCRAAATTVWAAMQAHPSPSSSDTASEKKEGQGQGTRGYTAAAWRAHELHPDPAKGEETVEFIFTMDLLNFCFWGEKGEGARFVVEYRGREWTGYWSLVAALRRALDEGSFFLHLFLLSGVGGEAD